MSILGAQKNFVLKQRDEATATLRPRAGGRVGGAYDRTVKDYDHRSRQQGIVLCRGGYYNEALLAMVLLAGSYGSEERLKGVSVAVTQLLNSKELWDYCMSKEELVREINRLLSLGPDQQTTLIDEMLRRHRSVKITGRGQDALSQVAEVLYLLGLFTYENTDDEERESDKYYTIVDGSVIKEIRDICVAVSSEHSHLKRAVHIEMALFTFFQMAVGDEDLAKLLAFVFAHCLFGAVGMVVARECCKQFRATLAAVAFNEDFLKARQDLVLALDGGGEAAIAGAVAAFNTVWASLEGQAREAYDHEKAIATHDQMQFQDLYQERDQQTTVIEALKTAKGKVTAFADIKGCESVGGAKPGPVGVVRVTLTAASLTEELKGYTASRNTAALKSDVTALLVAVGNGGVTNRLDAPLQPHLRGCGRRCQMGSYLHTFFNLRNSALLASIQADVWVYFHEERRWLHSSRPGEAAIEYGLLERAIDAGYSCVEEYLRDRRNSTDVTTLRCVREYRDGADAWDAAYEEPAEALLEEHEAYVAELDALTAAGQENGGKLATATVLVLGTQSYDSRGRLYGSGGKYGARVDNWDGVALWTTTPGTSTSGFARALAKEGATILDASTMIGYEQVEAPRGVEIAGAFDAIDVMTSFV